MTQSPEITQDLFYGGHLLLRQPAQGYRANVDTVLLAASVPAGSWGGRLAEPGCGVGGALMVLAANSGPETEIVGIEREPHYAALARENVALNGFQERVRIHEGDALAPGEALGLFDEVVINPPYDRPGEGRLPAETRRAAHVADRPLADWIKVWSNRMTGGAKLTMIHRADRLAEILAGLEGRLGGAEVFPIRPSAGKPARRVIVRARKGSAAPLKLLPGLDLHPEDAADKYTPQADAILRGHDYVRFD